MRHFPLLLGLLLALPVALRADPPVTVVVDLSPAGRKAQPASAEHPQYYLPVMRGYREYGPHRDGDQVPNPHDVVRAIAPQLARAGYFVVDGAHPRPDVVIDLAWGKIAKTDFPDERNQDQRYALSLGRTAMDVLMPEAFGHDEFMEATRDERYFLVVTAYDYAAYENTHKNVILWKAKMSVPTSGAFLADVILPLARAGGPQFGKETTDHPKLVPNAPVGHVEVGTPVEKHDTP